MQGFKDIRAEHLTEYYLLRIAGSVIDRITSFYYLQGGEHQIAIHPIRTRIQRAKLLPANRTLVMQTDKLIHFANEVFPLMAEVSKQPWESVGLGDGSERDQPILNVIGGP